MIAPPLVIVPEKRRRKWNIERQRDTRFHRALVVGLALILMFAVGAFGAVEAWAQLVLECGAALLFLGWLVKELYSKEVSVSLPPVLLPAVAFVLLAGAQLLFGVSAYAYATWRELLLYGAYGILFFLVFQLLRRKQDIKLFFWLIVPCASAFSLMAILQNFTGDGKLYWIREPRYSGWTFGPYVNHNHWAGFAEMMAPLPLVLAAGAGLERSQKVILGFATALIGATIFLSGSRGGMIAFLVQVVVAGVLLRRRKQGNPTGYKLAALLLVVFAMALWMGGMTVLDRAETILDSDSITQDMRMQIAKDAIAMTRERPLLGWGLDTFVTVYPQFRSFATTKQVNAAHNDYIQLLVETGVVGLVLMCWFLLEVFRSALRERDGGVKQIARQAALIGIVGILVHSLSDFNLHIPANAAIFFVLCAIAGGKMPRSKPRRQHEPLSS